MYLQGMGRTSDARNKILDAARVLVEQRGYTALGVGEICSTAGVPKGSFYYFFESKQALALTVIDEHRGRRSSSSGSRCSAVVRTRWGGCGCCSRRPRSVQRGEAGEDRPRGGAACSETWP